MKATLYTLKMSDNKTTGIRARSAGEAIYSALAQFPGTTVIHCHSGMDEAQCLGVRQRGGNPIPGITEYEIPPHKPLTDEQAALVRGDTED